MEQRSAAGQPMRRNTRQRQLVLDAVQARCDHPTAEDVYLDARRADDRISRGTVYRNLNLLADTGLITVIKTPGASRFDRRCDGHGHIVCGSCGAIADVPLPYSTGLDKEAACSTGFLVEGHSIVFEGLCPDCR